MISELTPDFSGVNSDLYLYSQRIWSPEIRQKTKPLLFDNQKFISSLAEAKKNLVFEFFLWLISRVIYWYIPYYFPYEIWIKLIFIKTVYTIMSSLYIVIYNKNGKHNLGKYTIQQPLNTQQYIWIWYINLLNKNARKYFYFLTLTLLNRNIFNFLFH